VNPVQPRLDKADKTIRWWLGAAGLGQVASRPSPAQHNPATQQLQEHRKAYCDELTVCSSPALRPAAGTHLVIVQAHILRLDAGLADGPSSSQHLEHYVLKGSALALSQLTECCQELLKRDPARTLGLDL
jgi:hypothetical protein